VSTTDTEAARLPIQSRSRNGELGFHVIRISAACSNLVPDTLFGYKDGDQMAQVPFEGKPTTASGLCGANAVVVIRVATGGVGSAVNIVRVWVRTAVGGAVARISPHSLMSAQARTPTASQVTMPALLWLL
jgi:hypothetical protein